MTSVFRGALRWLEGVLVGTAVTGRSLAHRRAWRAGRMLESTARIAHEALLHAGRRLGVTCLPAGLVQAAQERALKEAPRYPSFFPPVAGVPDRARALVDGSYVLPDGARGLLASLSWRRDPFGNRSSLERLRFHALEWVGELVQAWRVTFDSAYLDRARELTARWIADCLDRERSDNLWSDHGTPLRALVLCDLWHACRGEEAAGSAFMRSLLEAIARHADKLADKRLYRAEHNHGVTQAYALLAIGLLFPALPGAAAWTGLGRRRLEAQMAENVSPEGLHREHSPYYQFYVFRQFHYAQRLARAYGLLFAPEFSLRLDAMLAAGAHLVKPSGRLPAMGDSHMTSPVLVDPDDLEDHPGAAPAFSWSASGGRAGAPPDSPSVLFPGAGVAILRSGWGEREPFADERFLAVRLSTFETSHVHRDLLSFEFSAYGADLIVDSGGPFSYGHPDRGGYFLRTRAHNTVTVDGRDQAVGESAILHWQRTSAADAVMAEHRAYGDVRHRRLLALLRPDVVLVVDRLESAGRHRYVQLFHLSPELDARLEGPVVVTGRTAARPGQPATTVRVIPLLEAGLTATLSRGVSRPRQGWVTTGEDQMVAAPVVEYIREGHAVVFAALLVPERPGRVLDLSCALEGLPLDGEVHVELRRGTAREVIAIEPSGAVRVSRPA